MRKTEVATKLEGVITARPTHRIGEVIEGVAKACLLGQDVCKTPLSKAPGETNTGYRFPFPDLEGPPSIRNSLALSA